MRKLFGGIIEEARRLKEIGHSPIIHASHSNSKTVYNVPRNLTDEQIKVIVEEFDGTIGIVEYTQFCTNKKGLFEKTYEKYYLEHINYIGNLLGGIRKHFSINR